MKSYIILFLLLCSTVLAEETKVDDFVSTSALSLSISPRKDKVGPAEPMVFDINLRNGGRPVVIRDWTFFFNDSFEILIADSKGNPVSKTQYYRNADFGGDDYSNKRPFAYLEAGNLAKWALTLNYLYDMTKEDSYKVSVRVLVNPADAKPFWIGPASTDIIVSNKYASYPTTLVSEGVHVSTIPWLKYTEEDVQARWRLEGGELIKEK